MNLRQWLLLILGCSLFQFSAQSAGLIVVTDPAEPNWSIHPPPDPNPPPIRFRPPIPRGQALELKSHQVEVEVDDQFAVTRVNQSFQNPTGRTLEGTFLFPVPKGAQLSKFTMEIDGRPVSAELLKAEKARDIYESIVRRQRDPALLEFVERDLYKIRIFPIEPHATKRVQFAYEQLLTADSGLVRFEYPMSVERFSSKPIETVSFKLELKTGKPLKSIYSPTHELEIVRKSERHAVIGYETKGERSEQDLELFYSREGEGIGMSVMAYRNDAGEDGFFLLLASPGLKQDGEAVLPKDVIFVLDTSGSMADGKLEQARKALAFCVDNLNDHDRFEIVRFATDIEPLFGAMAPAGRAERQRAQEFINRSKPIGGTAINDALKSALKIRPDESDRPCMIVFLTDGKPTVGETRIDRIVSNVSPHDEADTRIFCFGIGNDVNTHLLDRITEKTRAYSQYVLAGEDLEIKVSNFYSRIKDPVLTRPELVLPESVRPNRWYPEPLPDVFNGDQLVVVGRYRNAADGAVQLKGKIGGDTRVFAEDIELPEHSDEHDFIPRLWATRRIGWLLDEIRLRGENQELIDEVTQLARRYGVVTPYTAWLIVEDEERRQLTDHFRTLPQNSQTRLALEYSRDSLRSFQTRQSGEAAVLGASSSQANRAASVPSSAAQARRAGVEDRVFLERYGLLDEPRPTAGNTAGSSAPAMKSEAAFTPSELTQLTRFVAGKTFFWNDGTWIDSLSQQQAGAPVKQVRVYSEEYFDLLNRDAAVRRWLSIGDQVQFVWKGTLYQVQK